MVSAEKLREKAKNLRAKAKLALLAGPEGTIAVEAAEMKAKKLEAKADRIDAEEKKKKEMKAAQTKEEEPKAEKPEAKPKGEKSSGKKSFGELIVFIVLVIVGLASNFFLSIGTWVWAPLGFFALIYFLKVILPAEVYDTIKKILWIIILGAILFYFLFFGKNLYTSGIWKGGAVAVDEAGVEKATESTLANVWSYVKNPQKLFYDYYSWTDPKTVEEEPKKGIEFYALEPRRDYFPEESKIVVYGTAKVSSISNSETTVELLCGITDEDVNRTGKIIIRGVVGESITVYPGYDEVIDFTCELEGIVLPVEMKNKNSTEKAVKTYIVDIFGIYKDFNTKTVLKVYNLKSEILSRTRDPFEGLKDPLLDSTGKVRSECLSGCGLTKLALKTAKQPQTEIGSYTVTLNLRKDSDWYGDLLELNEMKLVLPARNFEFLGCDERFGTNNILDSEDDYLIKLNSDLLKENFRTNADLTFYCDYKLTSPRERIGFDEIFAEATYDYVVLSKKTINIIQKTDLSNIANYVDNGDSDDDSLITGEGAKYYEV